MSDFSRRQWLLAALSSPWVLGAARAGIAAELGDEWPESPFLEDNFAPVHEEIAAADLPVIGKLPADLDGMFVRNGPNPRFPPTGDYHWFDGDGMLHGVRIKGGKASYRNRYVRTTGWRAEDRAGRALWGSLLDPDSTKDAVQNLLAGQIPFKNTANTSVVWHHDKLLALWEFGQPHEIEVPSLKTIGAYSFQSTLKHNFTAHPKIDPQTGEMMGLGYWPLPPYVQYSVVDRAGRVVHTTPIDVPRPVMMHDLAIAGGFTLFFDFPAVFNPVGALSGQPFVDFQPEHGARIGVLPRHAPGEEIRWFEIDGGFMFHVLNASARDGRIDVVGCRMPRYPALGEPAPVGADVFSELFNENKPVLYRWTLDLAASRVTEQVVHDANAEFPRIDDRRAGGTARFGYTVSGSAETSWIQKSDLRSEQTVRHWLGKGRIAGEGVFVPRAAHCAEDDGWVLTYVYDMAERASELVIVAAQGFSAKPVARIKLPQRVPYGFHAAWVPGENFS